MIIGLAAMIAAVLLCTPLVLRAVTARCGRLPVNGRLSWRELGRNQSRSAAALATVTIAVGMSVAAVVITAANTHPASAGNLSDRQILIPVTDPNDPAVVPQRTGSQIDTLDRAAAALAATLPSATAIPLRLAVDPSAPPSDEARATGGLDAAQAVQQQGGSLSPFPLYVATAQLLATLGGDPGQLSEQGYFALDPRGSWSLLYSQRAPIPTPGPLHANGYTSLPQVLVSPAVVVAQRWHSVPAGWLIQNPTPLSAQQLETARTRAAALGLAIETRDPQTYLGRLRLMFTIGGVVLTLAVIAIALVLLRVQTVRDQQILTAVGAPSRSRRTIAAITAATLATLGTTLGITGAYATLVLAYSNTLGRLANIPWLALATILVGIPVLTLGTSWLTASRQPPAINRPAID
jgi:hypothetical protein